MVDTVDEQGSAEIVLWNVMFLKGDQHHWWDVLTDPEWRHVCAFGMCGDRWIVYDVGDTRSCIMVMDDNTFDVWLEQRRERIKAVVQMAPQNDGKMRARLGFWCVTAVKHLLGLPSSALRPKALFRDLVHHGGKVIQLNGHESKCPRRKRRRSRSA